jgi:hypothetical protein
MTRRLLLLPAAALALSAGCSSGEVVACAACPKAVSVTVTGLNLGPGHSWRLRLCAGDQPCTDFRVLAWAADPCGNVACRVEPSGVLQISLDSTEPRAFAGKTVRVSASEKGRAVVQGSGKFTAVREPCVCPASNADVAVE